MFFTYAHIVITLGIRYTTDSVSHSLRSFLPSPPSVTHYVRSFLRKRVQCIHFVIQMRNRLEYYTYTEVTPSPFEITMSTTWMHTALDLSPLRYETTPDWSHSVQYSSAWWSNPVQATIWNQPRLSLFSVVLECRMVQPCISYVLKPAPTESVHCSVRVRDGPTQ